MKPGQCMYLHLVASDHTALDLVLSSDDDLYSEEWPGKYLMLEHKVKDDPSMQWYWNDKDGTFTNGANR